jgi:hypothetical protein
LDEYTKQLIEGARLAYRPILTGEDGRITRGTVLWDQFERAAGLCRTDAAGGERALAERINEMAVAKVLAEDKGLTRLISYEPDLLPDGRKIDFVAERADDNAYIEVKTVHPNTADTEEAWKRYEERRKLHPEQANFIVHKDWMGGKLYGDTFASRSKFLDYSMDFETRLAAAKKVKTGPGLLIFCGNGVRWHRSNLEDFADYYHAGKHRQDDPFAKMEQHHIEHEKLELLRNVDNFGCLVRPMEMAEKTGFVWPVRGPSFGGVVK